VVGLCLAPTEQAVVLPVDEKTQIQALDRTQRTLRLRPGQVELRTHGCRRGATSLIATLEDATGQADDRGAGAPRGERLRRRRCAGHRRVRALDWADSYAPDAATAVEVARQAVEPCSAQRSATLVAKVYVMLGDRESVRFEVSRGPAEAVRRYHEGLSS
jgi:hypothetical protein